ncbi:acyltransferase domain-containing protein [Paenarthrobacter aurescens]|uniref:acyltransferase domain-containing protein n=1 Tax=Paenarthrobacter aurescens TaxID=43663 RepID=UPI0021BFE6B2|nr:acyltransferase domain-containing protein [Paenarthrobacter aurescens]MCT9867748.1 acyltransferase domain-containing protein [Paenarthrobacter aurescens]
MATNAHAQLFDLLDITGDDAAECAGLLATPPDEAVLQAVAAMEERLGTFPLASIHADGASETEWIEALLRFAPSVHAYHLKLGISPAVSAASLADMGLQLRINRRVHGHFGLDTWGWLTLHMAGNLFRLGRLQFHLVSGSEEGGVAGAGSSWVLGVHIPEDGGLSPTLVDASMAEARTFFPQYFPDKPATLATCDSWMLDPYLVEHLPDSNIAAFARRFTLDRCTDAPTDAVYFTFRQRGLQGLDQLPRETSLQRVVLERIDDGGTWQLGHGHLAL